jgi:hypothetical protein
VHRQKPLGERNLAALHDRADRHRELAVALGAIVQAGPMGIALTLGDLLLIGVAAMRTERTIGPADRLQGFAGLIVIGKSGVLEIGGRGACPSMPLIYAPAVPLSSI